MSDRCEALLEQGIAEAATVGPPLVRQMYADLSAKCESPIETLFLAAFLPYLMVPTMLMPVGSCPLKMDIEPQKQIGPYRVDFAFSLSYGGFAPVQIVVECDGHDFHDRTPEQAARDKSRDRELKGAGWPTLRFTGREIVRDPNKCADDAHAVILNELGRIRSAEQHAVRRGE